MVAVTLSACHDAIDPAVSTEPDNEAAVGEPRALADRVWCAASPDEVRNQQGFRTPDDTFALWATSVPGGFAGFWFANDTLRFGLRDMKQSAAAIPALAEVSGRRGVPVEVRYDWLELYGCYRVANRVAAHIDGVVSSDIDEVRNRIVYGATTEAIRQKVTATVLAARIPRDMFDTKIASPIVIAFAAGKR
jgi:hypothetical protein